MSELSMKADIVKDAVADKAISVIEKYRKGGCHGREVLCALGPLFEAVNDTVERMVVQEALNPSKKDLKSNQKNQPNQDVFVKTKEMPFCAVEISIIKKKLEKEASGGNFVDDKDLLNAAKMLGELLQIKVGN